MNTVIGRPAAVLLILLLTACASSVKIKDTWRSPDAPAAAYQKILVVARAHNDSVRSMLEDITFETLSEHGVPAVPSHRLIGDLAKADSATLQSIAQAAGADAVVITRAISKQEHTDYQYLGGNIEARSVVIQKTDGDSSTTLAMSTVGIAPRETDFIEGYLQTRLFDAGTAKPVWIAHTKVVNDGSVGDACWDFAILLTQALAKDRLIVINDREFRKPTL